MRGYFFKMDNIVGNKLMGLLIIAGGGLLVGQEHIKKGEYGNKCP